MISVIIKTNNSGNELGLTNVAFDQQDVSNNKDVSGLRLQPTDEDVQVTIGSETAAMKDSLIENGFVNGCGVHIKGNGDLNTTKI